MQQDKFIIRLPHQGNLHFPSFPVFEMEEEFGNFHIMPLTRKDLTIILKAHQVFEGWLIPYRPAEEEGLFSHDQRVVDMCEVYLADNLPHYEGIVVPDIKGNNRLLQAIFLIDPPEQALSEMILRAQIDFVVQVSMCCGDAEADTQLMDVFQMPLHSN